MIYSLQCIGCEFLHDCEIKKEAERYEGKDYKPMTNEEWFCSLTTEEKAEVITIFIQRVELLNYSKEAWLRWLKEIHDDSMRT